jgi:hypothetical protein
MGDTSYVIPAKRWWNHTKEFFMRNFFKARIASLFGVIALVAIIGFSMAACDNDDGGGGNGDGGSNEKSIRITGLDDFYGSSYQLGLATTVDKLYYEDLVAFAEGTIRSGTQTAPLLNYRTGDPWTGSGSYFVGVYLDGYAFVTKSRKSFNSSVTTLSIDDFDYAD